MFIKFVVRVYGRTPKNKKIIKILDWPLYRNTTKAKGFVGFYVYYRLWVKDFAFIAESIYILFKKKSAIRLEHRLR